MVIPVMGIKNVTCRQDSRVFACLDVVESTVRYDTAFVMWLSCARV